jgi:hypothetical protein
MVVVMALLCVACTSGEEEGAPPAAATVTTLDAARPMSQLGSVDAQRFCDEARTFMKGRIDPAEQWEFNCGMEALGASVGAEDDDMAEHLCRQRFQVCLDRASLLTEDVCKTFDFWLKDCAASVGEVSACFADETAALTRLVSKDWCADAKVGIAAPFHVRPKSCVSLDATCPELSGKDVVEQRR